MEATQMTTTEITPELIAQIQQRIVADIHPLKIIMFGSQASGNGSRESDLDLLIIHDTPQPSRQVRRQLERLFLQRRFGLDLFVRTAEEVALNLQDGNPFYTEHIFNRGVVLYDRASQKTH